MSVDTYPTSVLNAQLWNGQSMPLSITGGGTGATTAAQARTNLELDTMATQNANSVAITGGAISLGGAGTGLAQLSVRGNTQASDASNFWMTLRLYPHTSAASTSMIPLRIQNPELTGSGSLADYTGLQIIPFTNATNTIIGISVLNPATAGNVWGYHSAVAAGANRYNIYADGTAPNYFAGNVGIGTTPTNARVEISYTAGAGAIQTRPAVTGGGVYPMYFLNNAGSNIGSISTTDTATAYNTSSDARLKEAIEPLRNALACIQALKPIEFLWNFDKSKGHGFAAHELQQVIPEAVTGEPDALNDDGSINPQQVDFSKLVPWLVGAVQELSARLNVLEEALA